MPDGTGEGAAKLRPIQRDDALSKIVTTQASPPPAPDIDLRWGAPADLLVDARYQRLISERGRRTIRQIIAGFSWARFGALTVAQTREGLAVIDGQHRAIAAYHLGLIAIPMCIWQQNATAAQAEAFIGINCTRISVPSVDKFRARVAAGDPAACAVAGILRDLNVSIDTVPGVSLKPYQTRATQRLERLVKDLGRGTVYTALDMLIDAQGEQDNLLTTKTVWAVTLATDRLISAGADMDAFVALLREVDFESLADEAMQLTKIKGGQSGPHAAQLLLDRWNKGRQKRVML